MVYFKRHITDRFKYEIMVHFYLIPFDITHFSEIWKYLVVLIARTISFWQHNVLTYLPKRAKQCGKLIHPTRSAPEDQSPH